MVSSNGNGWGCMVPVFTGNGSGFMAPVHVPLLIRILYSASLRSAAPLLDQTPEHSTQAVGIVPRDAHFGVGDALPPVMAPKNSVRFTDFTSGVAKEANFVAR